MSKKEGGVNINARTERLRTLCKKVGGNVWVARRAGIPPGTLNKYLAGRDMPTANAVSIAKACSVSIEWFLTGEGAEERRSDDTDRAAAVAALARSFQEAMDHLPHREQLAVAATLLGGLIADVVPDQRARLLNDMVDAIREGLPS